MLRWLLPSKPPGLGRWCHPTSEWYRTCDQARKSMLADYDNGCHSLTSQASSQASSPASSPSEPTRDAVTVFLYE